HRCSFPQALSRARFRRPGGRMRNMQSLIGAVLLCAFISASLAATGTKRPGQGQTSAPQSVSLVISATDSNGNPLAGLSKDQVSVSDGKEAMQTLGVQSASDLPLHLGFVLLASKSKFDQEQAATVAMAQKILRPGIDEAFVITAGGDKSWTDSHIGWLKDAPSVTETVHS